MATYRMLRRMRPLSRIGEVRVLRKVSPTRKRSFFVQKPLLNARKVKDFTSVGEKRSHDNGKRVFTGDFKENIVGSKKILDRVQSRAEKAAQNMVKNALTAYSQRKISQNELRRVLAGISEKRAKIQGKASHQLKRLNQRDSMITALFNKEHFLNTVIPEFFSQHRNAGLVILDIDHFKSINSGFGHLKADNAIRLFGQCVNEAAKSVKGFAGRFGGDEMMAVLPNGIEDARRFALNLNSILLARFGEKTHQFLRSKQFTFSGGFALAREGKTIEEVKELADQRAYISKDKGRNRFTFRGKSRLETMVVRR